MGPGPLRWKDHCKLLPRLEFCFLSSWCSAFNTLGDHINRFPLLLRSNKKLLGWPTMVNWKSVMLLFLEVWFALIPFWIVGFSPRHFSRINVGLTFLLSSKRTIWELILVRSKTGDSLTDVKESVSSSCHSRRADRECFFDNMLGIC